MSQQQPSEEELRAALEEEMRKLTPDDVIVQTAITLVNLAGRKLGLGAATSGSAEKDLGQARTAIEGVRALLPLVPKEPQAPIRDALAQLQMSYAQEARAAGEQPAAEPSAQPETPPQQAPARGAEAGDEAERAKARSKIWTPPGS
jgi:hypothetical protein